MAVANSTVNLKNLRFCQAKNSFFRVDRHSLVPSAYVQGFNPQCSKHTSYFLHREIYLFDLFKKKQPLERPEQFPPVPDWKPEIGQPLERISERIRFYTNASRDFAIFSHGTVAILPNGLSDADAEKHAKESLGKVFHAHPDMNPLSMKDGNILVQYNHDVASLVLSDIANDNFAEIDRQHQRALATSEVLISPLGHNIFDDFGKKALFGRCYMFMDAQSPSVVRIERHERELPGKKDA